MQTGKDEEAHAWVTEIDDARNRVQMDWSGIAARLMHEGQELARLTYEPGGYGVRVGNKTVAVLGSEYKAMKKAEKVLERRRG